MEEDGGKRDEGHRLDMGPPGTTSHRTKPVASLVEALCAPTVQVYARRGLSKYICKYSMNMIQNGPSIVTRSSGPNTVLPT